MKVVAFNGSPRKKWNTAMLLEKALEGAASHATPPKPIFPKKVNTGFIYTMNASEGEMRHFWTRHIVLDQFFVEESLPGLETYQSTLHIAVNEFIMKMVFGSAESLLSCETYQFEDYSKVVSSLFDPEQRKQRRKEVFPKDCEKAFEMGARFAGKNK
jgi:hypothetical protein